MYPNFHVNNSEATKVEPEVIDTRNQYQDSKPGVDESEAKTVTTAGTDREIKNTLKAAKASKRSPVCRATAGEKHHTTNAPNDGACNQNYLEDICVAEKLPGNVDDSNNMVSSDALVRVDYLACTTTGKRVEVKTIVKENSSNFLNSSSTENGSCTKDAVNVDADNSETTSCVTDENIGLSDICTINIHSGNELELARINSVSDGSKPFPNAYCCSMVNENIESVALSGASDDNELVDLKTQESVREAKITSGANWSKQKNKASDELNQVASFVNASSDKNNEDARYEVDSVTIMKSSCTRNSNEKVDSTDKCNEVDSVVVGKLRNTTDHDGSLDSTDKLNEIDCVVAINSNCETKYDGNVNQADITSGVDNTAALKISSVTSGNGKLSFNENSDAVESIETMELSCTTNDDEKLNLIDKSDGADDSATIMKTSFLADDIGKLDSAEKSSCKNYSNVATSLNASDEETVQKPFNKTNTSSGGESKEFICVDELLESEDFSDSQLIQTAATCMIADLRSLRYFIFAYNIIIILSNSYFI